MSIRTRFLLLSNCILLLIFGGMTIYLTTISTNNLRHQLQTNAKSFAALATTPIGDAYHIYKDSGTQRIHDAMQDYLGLTDIVTNAAVVNVSGKTLFSYDGKQTPRVSESDAATFKTIYKYDRDGKLAQVIQPYFEASGIHQYSVVYRVSNASIDQAIRQQVTSFVLFGVLSLLLTSAVIYILTNRSIIKPIQDLSEQAAVISKGNLEGKIEVKGKDEIASLGQAVNTMAESLKAYITQLREIDKVKSEFMAITSHNLRTPLTIISGYLETSEKLDSIDKLKNALKHIAASVQRLNGFAEDVLTISRFEMGEQGSDRELVPLGDFVRRIVDDATPSAEIKEIKMDLSVGENATVRISKPYIKSAIWNILDNSIKFTANGGSIHVSVTTNNDQAVIKVTDTGIGIKSDELPKLFTKFHRGTSTLTYDYEGTGIGLYTSKIIVENHGGTINVSSQESKGSSFEISLPIADNA